MKYEFWPEDTEEEFFLAFGATFEEILDQAIEKWGIASSDFSRIQIEAAYMHTSHLSYDLYDSGDYTNFLCISLKP